MEGVGPLAFAWMLPRAEGTALPGAPWLICAGWVGVSLALCLRLEDTIKPHLARALPSGPPGARCKSQIVDSGQPGYT